MDLKNRHPLNAIDGYENLSMLEALIPFVDYQLKLPLALFIKFNEVRLIIKCFQSPHNLSRLGLHCATNDPFDMIGSLTGMSPDLIKTMMSMMDVGDNSMFSDLFNNFTNNNSTNFTNEYHSSTAPTGQHPPQSSDDFEDNIQRLLAEYDLQQADSLRAEANSHHNHYE